MGQIEPQTPSDCSPGYAVITVRALQSARTEADQLLDAAPAKVVHAFTARNGSARRFHACALPALQYRKLVDQRHFRRKSAKKSVGAQTEGGNCYGVRSTTGLK